MYSTSLHVLNPLFCCTLLALRWAGNCLLPYYFRYQHAVNLGIQDVPRRIHHPWDPPTEEHVSWGKRDHISGAHLKSSKWDSIVVMQSVF